MLVIVLSTASSVAADERPNPRDVGQFLGISLNCGCLAHDNGYLAAFYYATFAEDYDQSFAEAMSGEMRLYAKTDWRNQASLCADICQSEIMLDMDYLIDRADLAMSSPVFRQYFDDALERFSPGREDRDDESKNYGRWQTCFWRPNSALCLSQDDLSSPLETRQADAELPACSATEDLVPGIGCEGRQKGRVSGY